MTFRIGAAAVALAGCLVLPSCSSSRQQVAQDPSAVKQEYLDLTQKAMAEVRAWSSADGSVPDPRPVWAARLEEFAAAHPGAPEAAEALSGVMQMRAAMLDADGFFKTFDLMLKICPDAASVAGVFPQVSAMRMAEAGGRAAIESMDYSVKQRAWRRAVPGIVADMQRVMKATTTASTTAAAEFTIAMSWYRFDVDLRKALEHFKIVASQYPASSNAELARGYVNEIEKLGPGNLAPDFETVSIDGTKASLSALKGKIVLLDFWATWCQPCMNELPNLKRAYERFHPEGFTIVGVSADTDRAALNRFVAKEGMRWPVIVADASGLGPADPIFRAYSVQAIPMSYLIDRTGRIRGRALFGAEVERTVGELIEMKSLR